MGNGLKTSIFPALLLLSGLSFSNAQTPFYDLDVTISPETHRVFVEGDISFPSTMIEDGILKLLHAPVVDSLDITSESLEHFESDTSGNGPSTHTLSFSEGHPDEITIRISYSVFIPTDHNINRLTPEWIELNLDSFWVPIFSAIPHIRYEITVDLGGDYTLMTGDNYRKTGEGQYIIEDAVPRRDIPFSAGMDLRAVEGTLSAAYSPLDSVNLENIVVKSDSILSFLRAYAGRAEDFYNPRIVVITPREEVGYSRKNYIAMSDVRSFTDQYLSGYLAHEFSHYWFSNANFQTKHHWLTESFAEYLSMIYMREVYGEKWFSNDLEKKKTRLEEDPRKLAEFDSRPSFLALYYRGPLVLHAFEEFVGEQSFRKIIRAFIREDIRTNEELFDMIREELGTEASEKLLEFHAAI
ncbi:MAG: hypothetical protein JJ971_03960 [Balneolaceae bacterium]|nr:hypothetical protein [Balneolaceae bacterium]MBO6545528.1 hypothetical protein [Balneolaceae bacterium]MBO6646924.1 hypothetical protein [Balneolaceae bacterium]